MFNVLQAFKDNVIEVDEYFAFLEKIEEGYNTLNDHTGRTFNIDADLSRMLKANAFLIVYNLIEATIKSGLWEIFENLKTDKLSFEKMIKELQILWIDHKIKLEFKTQDDSVNNQILRTINSILQDSITYYTHKQHLKFDAGSLDITGINATFKRHGLKTLGTHKLISDSFLSTKKNRNGLAHGDMTFKECGKIYSYRDLRIIKCHIIRHLFKSLFMIKSFIDDKKYESPLPSQVVN